MGTKKEGSSLPRDYSPRIFPYLGGTPPPHYEKQAIQPGIYTSPLQEFENLGMDSVRLIEKEALFVGRVKSLSTDTDVKKLFDRYLPSESKERNIELLGNSSEVKKSHLESAMKVLSILAEDYPEPVRKLQSSKSSTKLLMGTEIVTFIRAACLSSCRKFSSQYFPITRITLEAN